MRAFQAQRGLLSDGIVGPNTYNALGAPPTPPPAGQRSPSITIDLDQPKLYLERRGLPRRVYDVAVGKPSTPTPVGWWLIVQKSMNPGGPFGTRWMRLNVPWGAYGIHGTNDPSSIGKAVSHGCVRMQNGAVEELYSLVPIGTPVNIIGKLGSGSVLHEGMEGAEVRFVQEALQSLGYYSGALDGLFGPLTLRAVRAFQRDQRLTPDDGVVGALTYERLHRALDTAQQSTEP